LKRIDGTGGNGDNREIARVPALFSPSTLFPPLLLDIQPGLIINFNELKLTDGASRLILPGANPESVNRED
jgi:hypothetical protein